MPFKRFVETGRVALISDGPNKGKLVSIVDVIDQTRVLIDGPASNVTRGQIRLSQLHLTKFRLKFPYTGSTKVVRKAWKAAQIDEKWAESAWSKKVEAKNKRAAMGDFDRFKLRKARQRRNKIRTQAFLTIRMKAARNGSLFGKKTKGGDKAKPKKKTAAPAAAAPPQPVAAVKKTPAPKASAKASAPKGQGKAPAAAPKK